MKRLIYLFALILLVSCQKYVEKPKNLVDKETMTKLMADLALNDQIIYYYPGKNLESGTRYILKNHNVKADDFIESYRYYVAVKKMAAIVEDAQKIILEQDPKAEKFIKEKTNGNNGVPNIER